MSFDKTRVPKTANKLKNFDESVVVYGFATINGVAVTIKKYPSVKENPDFYQKRRDIRQKAGMRLAFH